MNVDNENHHPFSCGINNPGSLCYMISILQQLYACDQFRDVLLLQSSLPINRFGSVISTLKELFTLLHSPQSGAIIENGILNSLLDSSLSIDTQQDVAQYFSRLSSRIESDLTNISISMPWVGQLVHIVQRGPVLDLRPEKFYYLSLNIKGVNGDVSRNNLHAALQDFTHAMSFPVGGAEIVKTCKFQHLPSRLVFHLKRFDYSYSAGITLKINEHFSFPQTLDMSEFLYCSSKDPPSTATSSTHDSPDTQSFTLSGVIVHKGSADSGHYYSLVRRLRDDGLSEWLMFDDAKVTSFDIARLENVCFGRRGRSNDGKSSKDNENAIMVIYDEVK